MLTINEVLKQFSKTLNDAFTVREKKQIGKMFLLSYLNISATDLMLRKNEVVDDSMGEKFNRAIEAINAGTPVQYVLGKAYFYGLELKIDERALIPRPETEELVDWVLESVNSSSSFSILDVGTGSGCIALALKDNLPNAEVFGVDQSDEALNLSQSNAKLLDLDVTFKKADALHLNAFFHRKWDVIVSNPPYIPTAEAAQMKPHVVDFEPKMALFVPDDDPLLFYKSIAQYAKENLNKNGKLFFEVHEDLAKETYELLLERGFSNVEIRTDLQEKERMVKGEL